MVKNRIKNKSWILIGSIFIFISLIMLSFKFITDYHQTSKIKNSIDYFWQNNFPNEEPSFKEETIIPLAIYDYIAVLEIPALNLKRGLFAINDQRNNLNQNLEILTNSDMPNIESGLMIIAGHSGRSSVSFFKNLDSLKEKDKIYLYYQNIRYIYEVSTLLRQDKTGNIFLSRSNNAELILTTCDPKSKDKQFIVVAKLFAKNPY